MFLQNKCLFLAHAKCPTSIDGKDSDLCWQGSMLMEALPFYDTLSQSKASNLLNTHKGSIEKSSAASLGIWPRNNKHHFQL